VQEEVKGRVQITFDGKPVHDVRMVILHLLNTGNVPIEESDYVHPIGFTFGEGANILSAEVVETRPPDMKTSLHIDGRKVHLHPDILNGGDGVELRILLTGSDEVRPTGRIKGINQVQELHEPGGSLVRLLALLFGPLAALTLLTVVADSLGLVNFEALRADYGTRYSIVAFTLLGGSFIGPFVYVFRQQRRWRRL
jgi:hypothetical protein